METFDLTQTGAQVQDILDKAAQLPSKATLDTELNAKADKSNTYTKAEVDQLVQTLENGSYERVDTYEDLGDPTEEKAGIIWLVGAEDAEEFERYIVGHNGDNLEWVYMGTTAVDLTGKADKVADAVDGDLAGLDSDGNLTDSGYKPADFATAAQGAKADSAYQLPGSGIPMDDLATEVQNTLNRVYNKADKVGSGHTDKLATFNSAGNLKDSGIGVEDVALKDSSNPAMLVGSALGIMGNTPQAALYTHRAVPAGAGSGAAQMRLLRGRSIVWNQLVGADTESVTIPSGHKYYAVINGVASVATSDGSAIAVTGGQDMVIDLTTMTMPDLTAPAFEALYPGFHGFNAGTIKNLKATGLLSDGFNKLNIANIGVSNALLNQNGQVVENANSNISSFVQVDPSRDYYFKDVLASTSTSSAICWYDANKVFISSVVGASAVNGQVITSPSNAAYLRASIYKPTEQSACINRSNPARNGQYEPYRSYTMSLPITTMTGKAGGVGDSVVIYPNGMMGAGTDFDYGRVDADGWWRRTQKVMVKEKLGQKSIYPIATGCYYISGVNSVNVICEKYNYIGTGITDAAIQAAPDMSYGTSSVGQIKFKDTSCANADAFKSANANTNIIYKLDTPVEYVLDTPIYMGYAMAKGGTETMLPDQTGLSEPTSSPIDYDVVYPIDLAGNLVTELNAMLTANSLAGSFAKNGNGGVTYSAE